MTLENNIFCKLLGVLLMATVMDTRAVPSEHHTLNEEIKETNNEVINEWLKNEHEDSTSHLSVADSSSLKKKTEQEKELVKYLQKKKDSKGGVKQSEEEIEEMRQKCLLYTTKDRCNSIYVWFYFCYPISDHPMCQCARNLIWMDD